MTFKSFTRAAAAVVVALLALSGVSWAQTTITSTTLSAAISDTSGQVMSVTSATGFTAGSTMALIDAELVNVRTVNSTVIGVTRGVGGTRASTHVSGSTVWVGPPTAYNSYVPFGQCTRTNLVYVPWLVAGDQDITNNGLALDCMGVTTAGQWVQVNRPGPAVLGSTVASAASSIIITGNYYKVSGTNAITGFTVPAGLAAGWCFNVEPTGIYTTTNAGNINVASTAVVGKIMTFCWSGTKWNASY